MSPNDRQAAASSGALIEARSIRRRYSEGGRVIDALDGVDVSVHAGERVGIVGESGSGKTTLMRILAALDRPSAGETLFRGRPVSHVSERQLADLRSSVQVVFQDPRSSLDPRMTVGRIVTEPLRARRLRARGGVPRNIAERLDTVLAAVGLPLEFARRYPHELSGGQRQRIAIARALAPEPEVLIADEPVSALDVGVRAQVVNLLADLVNANGLTLIVVSHDLAVVRLLCDRIVVMKSGRIVEQGPMQQVYEQPHDPYTAALIAAMPKLPE